MFPVRVWPSSSLPFHSHWERPGEGSSPKAAMFPVRVWPSSSLPFLSHWERLGEGGFPKAAKLPVRSWPSLALPFRSHWERPGEGSSPKAAMFPVRVWPSSSLRFLSLWERLGEGGSPKAAKFPLRAWPSLALRFLSHWERPGQGSSPKAAKISVRIWPPTTRPLAPALYSEPPATHFLPRPAYAATGLAQNGFSLEDRLQSIASLHCEHFTVNMRHVPRTQPVLAPPRSKNVQGFACTRINPDRYFYCGRTCTINAALFEPIGVVPSTVLRPNGAVNTVSRLHSRSSLSCGVTAMLK